MRIDNAASAIKNLASPPQSQPQDSSPGFGDMLMDAIKELNQTEQKSVGLQNDLMAGRPVEYHTLMIAMERASTAMSLTMQVRNKLLDAYQEISRMNV